MLTEIRGCRLVLSELRTPTLDATTLEWQTPTPPGHGNFTKPVEVFRGPYEYSVPGAAKDFTPQNEPNKA